MTAYILLVISAVLINNVVLSQFLGICPFMGVSNKVDTSIGMSAAVIFVLTLSAILTYLLQKIVLEPLKIEFMQTVSFILVIASLVQLVEIILKKSAPSLYQALGIFLPLISTNCAVLGISILSIQKNYDLIETSIFSFASGIGFGLALILFAGIREQLELSNVPKAMKGIPIAMLTAGILAMAFVGFSGMVK